MSTKNKLRTGIFTATFALLSLGLNAQTLPNTPTPPTSAHWTEFTAAGTVESIDSVTVGSRMPYRVAPQDNVPTGLTVQCKWLFSNGAPIQSLAGATLTGVDDYYDGVNEISVVMPTATGDITINTNVRYMMGTTPLCATATDNTYAVRVVPRPTISWAETPVPIVACVATPVTIPVTVTGYRQFEVEYTVEYWSTFDKSGSSTTNSEWVVLTGNQLIFPETMFPATGVYEISITNITDRISRKSLDMSLVAAQSSDLPGGAYTVMIIPAPTTNPLQHIKNMP